MSTIFAIFLVTFCVICVLAWRVGKALAETEPDLLPPDPHVERLSKALAQEQAKREKYERHLRALWVVGSQYVGTAGEMGEYARQGLEGDDK